MKKLYMLLMATLIVATAGAQTAISQVKVPADKKMVAPLKQLPTDKALRGGGPGALSIPYFMWDLYAFMPNATIQDLTVAHVWIIQNDTLGLVPYHTSQGDYNDHPYVFSWSQTYDLNSFFYDEFIGEGNMSLTSSTLNIDTFTLLCDYVRDSQMDPNVIDTLLVGFVFDDNADVMEFTGYPNTCFFEFDYDVNTGVQQNPTHLFRIPLGPEDVADSAHYSVITFPVGLTNITANTWNVAVSFKRGYNIGVNENLPSYFKVYAVTSADPDYYLGTDQTGIVDDPYRCDNKSHGGMVWDWWVNYTTSHNMTPFYYPQFDDADDNFLFGLYLDVSCDDCEIVNVPELEKNNLTIYPNPATNNFTVNLGNDEKANIQLFNIVGQQVMSETITGTAQVNVANLNSGVYMLKINQNGKVYTTKVIVK